MNSTRRSLRFENLDQVAEELDRLLESGYTATGKWNLSQIAGHLDDWMRFSLDGFPEQPAPIRAVLWLMKVTVGRRQLQGVLKNGFRDRLPTMPDTVPAADRTGDAEAVQQLTGTIDRFKASAGPFHASPIYGPLTNDEVLQLQLTHCAHHLRFLNPKA